MLMHKFIIFFSIALISLTLIFLTSIELNAFIVFFMLSVLLFLLYFNSDRSKVLLLILSSIFFGFTILEVLILINTKHFLPKKIGMPIYSKHASEIWSKDKQLGYKAKPLSLVRASKFLDNKEIYNVEYYFSINGLRETKSNGSSSCNYYFFGGSEMFGEGLPNLQTIPYLFSTLTNYNYNVKNYSLPEHGLDKLLRLIENNDINLSEDTKNFVFYFLTNDEISKITQLNMFAPDNPKYILDENELVYSNSLSYFNRFFISTYELKLNIINILKNSKLIDLFFSSLFKDIVYQDENSYQLLNAILIKINNIIKTNYNSKLIVLLKNDTSISKQILDTLPKNIKYINASELLASDFGSEYFFSDNTTLNQKAVQEIANGLANRFGACE